MSKLSILLRDKIVNTVENNLIELLADCQKSLLLLRKNMAAGGIRKNESVEHNVEFTQQTIVHSLERLASGDIKRAQALANIAVLRCDYAGKIFEAERIETLLGESDFLDLYPRWQRQAEEAFVKMETAINQIENRHKIESH